MGAIGIGVGMWTPGGAPGAWGGVSNPAARWSATDSVKTAALDGTGAAPSDAGRCGRSLDLANSYYLTSSADAARPLWYQNALGFGRASWFIDLAAFRDLFNNTTLAADVFSGADNPWTICMLYARSTEDAGSNSYIWTVLGSGDTIGGGAGNPCFTLRNDNALMVATNPLFAQGFQRDGDAALAGTSTFDDGVLGLGAGSASIVCVMVVKNPDRTVQVYQNGYQIATLTHSAGTFTFADGSYVNWGVSYNGAARLGNFLGHLFEMCVFARALTAAERHATFAGYLGSLGVQYSPNTPGSRKTTWVFGNSIMLGNLPTIGSPIQRLQRGGRLPWDETIVISNQSRGGLRFDLAGATNDLLECWAAKHGTATTIKAGDIIVGGEITNYIASADDTNNGTMQTALDAAMVKMKVFVDEMLSETDRVIVMIDPPLGTANAVRKWGLNYWKDQCLLVFGRKDRATVCNHYPLFDDGTGTLLAQYNSGDDVHLNGPAYELIADLLARIYTHQRSINPATHANLVFWASARNQLSTLTDGAAMSAIDDLSTANRDCAQGTGGNQPTFRVGTLATNWMPVVRFDTSDDFMTFTQFSLAAWTIFIVVKTNAADARILHDEAGGNGFVRLLDVNTTRVRAGAGNTVRFTHAARSDFDILVIRSDARMWVNGVEATRSDVESQAFNANFVADQLGRSANPFASDLSDVLALNAALSIADVNRLGAYLASEFKCAKAWTPVMS